ncbi:MAG: TolC family protein [Bacteroidetes bacterium]|nr:TolC family protein [Bacteroidota bacterium]
MRRFALLLGLALFTQQLFSQEVWDLRRCVDHAVQNNISVRQADLQARFSQLSYTQVKNGQLPSVNFGGSTGYRLGRSENPTTGVLEDNNFINVGMQLQSSVTLFNWFSRKYNTEASKLTWDADREQTQKTKNDISLNVAVGYLQALLGMEQVRLAEVQLELTRTQYTTTRRRVEAGALPELSAAELEAQVARDSASLINAKGSVQLLLLQLKALLNLDAGLPFQIATPPVASIPLLPLSDLQPEAVYATAVTLLPQQKVNELRLQAARKQTQAARSALYPSITAFGSLATNTISFKKAIYEQVLTGYSPTALRVNAGGGTFYPVELPNYIDGSNVVGYFRPGSITNQFSKNFGQSIGIGLNVPIFNGQSARINWQRSQYTIKQWELQKEQGQLQLKQDIYKAYTDAVTALQQYTARQRAVETAEKAYEFASKRFDLNLLSAFDLINSRNNLLSARSQLLSSQYDYVFKMKLLEFYRGQGLKL